MSSFNESEQLFRDNCYTNLEGYEIDVSLDGVISINDVKYNRSDSFIIMDRQSHMETLPLKSRNSGRVFNAPCNDFCLDSIIMKLFGTPKDDSEGLDNTSSSNSFAEEDDETSREEKENFSQMDTDRIISDLSVVVLSKLMYENNLIGYRFRLNKGCLDISIDKGRELGIVPYKIGKKVQLQATNGVLASKYECSNKILFPDISNNDELCRKLLGVVLS